MAHTVLFPAITYVYPIGNTSAVVLTDTLAPDEPADLLLLGCGDPRNILFTVYDQPDDSENQQFCPHSINLHIDFQPRELWISPVATSSPQCWVNPSSYVKRPLT